MRKTAVLLLYLNHDFFSAKIFAVDKINVSHSMVSGSQALLW